MNQIFANTPQLLYSHFGDALKTHVSQRGRLRTVKYLLREIETQQKDLCMAHRRAYDVLLLEGGRNAAEACIKEEGLFGSQVAPQSVELRAHTDHLEDLVYVLPATSM
jgi:hypothetical protein